MKSKNNVLIFLCLVIFSLAIISSSSAATTIYVNNATGNDDNNGLTNTTAKATIQNGTNTVEAGGTVYVADGIYQEHITINKNLTLIGQSTMGTIIDGTHNGRPLTITPGLTVNLTNISIVNGKVTSHWAEGGGIYNPGILTMTNCNVENNIANGYSGDHTYADGGGISNIGTLTMTNCNVRNNTATATCSQGSGAEDADALGGGIYNSGTLTMTNCNLEKNTVFSDWSKYFALGGGLCNAGIAQIRGCNIINNIANSTGLPTDGGGIICFQAGSLTANFNRIINNTPNSIGSWWGGTINSIEDNWWGSNDPAFGNLLAGVAPPTSWLYMTINSTPSTINNTQTSLIVVSFNNRYNGTAVTPYTPGMAEYIPEGTLVTFTTDLGNIGSKTTTKYTSSGVAVATLTADETPGTAHITGLTDSQLMNLDVAINPKSSLYLTVTSNNANPKVGDTVIYTLKVGNNGPDTAKDVVMTYIVPEGLEFAGAKVDNGTWTYDSNTRTITWNLGDVPKGDPYLWLSLRLAQPGQYLINPFLRTSTYDPTLNSNMGSLTVNAASTVQAAGTIGMQNTGGPLAGILLGILLVLGGLVTSRKNTIRD